MKWFGPTPFAHACDVTERTGTPLVACFWCHEKFAPADHGVVLPYSSLNDERELPYHRDCFLRQIVGSVGHQLGRCSCVGGTEEDPPELSLREAARLAVEMYYGGKGAPS